MKLEELRKELDTDAKKRCAAQEETIKRLNVEIKAKDGQIMALQNRCWVLTHGALCTHCNMLSTCKGVYRGATHE